MEGIEQYYIALEREEWKFDTLWFVLLSLSVLTHEGLPVRFCSDLYEALSIQQCVIFANTRRQVEWLTRMMTENDHTVSAIVSVFLENPGFST